jgi:hypothetical protein
LHELTQKILFTNGRQAQWSSLSSLSDLDQTLAKLGLSIPTPAMVLVGGAAGIEPRHEALIQQTVALLARLADELEVAVLDGGTQSGVKAFMGEARTASNHNFPLVGLAVEKLIHWHERPANAMSVALEPNHTHFLFVPGQEWGEESFWLSEAASRVSGNLPSLTILLNGGEISRQDVNHSLRAKRPVLIIEGTGRLADELAVTLSSPLVKVVSANDPQYVASTVRTFLTRR